MKQIIAILLLVVINLSWAGGNLVNSPNQFATLQWSYPTNYFDSLQALMQTTVTNPAAWPALTNVSYYLYETATLNGTNTQWNFYVATNNPSIITNSDGSLCHRISVPLLFPAQQQFFSIQASNATGKSFFSGLAATPLPPPTQGSFQILSTQ